MVALSECSVHIINVVRVNASGKMKRKIQPPPDSVRISTIPICRGEESMSGLFPTTFSDTHRVEDTAKKVDGCEDAYP